MRRDAWYSTDVAAVGYGLRPFDFAQGDTQHPVWRGKTGLLATGETGVV